MSYKTEDGFDEDSSIQKIIDVYGVKHTHKAAEVDLSASPIPKKQAASATKAKKKRQAEDDEEDSADDGDDVKSTKNSSSKKPKKSETFLVEDNRPLAEAIKEMADICFKNKDARKGGVISFYLEVFLSIV